MNEKPLSQFEARLEQLVEGVFTQVFQRGIRAQDIALKLARAMEKGLLPGRGDDPRPIAPDEYLIFVHSRVQQRLHELRPGLTDTLAVHLVELATQSGYVLPNTPRVKLLPDDDKAESEIGVRARHSQKQRHSTQGMQPIPFQQADDQRPRAQLIINGERHVPITEPLLNIGRSDQNHIVLDDPYVSRHHLQLRLRFGQYTLFDVSSRGGTRVNQVRVSEHRLQSGDVIRIGESQLIYMEEPPLSDMADTTTQSLLPVDPQDER